MARTNRGNRPYARTRKTDQKWRGPGRLAALAGGLERPTVEPLEQRQMLFSISVSTDDVNPFTGIGTVTQRFAYFNHVLVPTQDIQQPQDPTTRTEDFNDEPIGPIGSGRFFLGSGIRLRHNIPVPGNIAVDAIPPNATNNARWLRAALLQPGHQFSFQLYNDATNPTALFYATTVTFTARPDGAGDTSALQPDRMRVSLIFNNTVIASFTGNQLRQQVVPGTGNADNGAATFAFNAPVGTAFDSVRIEATDTPLQGSPAAFQIDDLSFTIPDNPFGSNLRGTVTPVTLQLSGPVGATATVLDLYGRDMVATFDLFTGSYINFDPDGDGIPFGNDGIGRVLLSGTDSRTSLTLIGGTLAEAQTPPANADFFVNGKAYTLPETMAGTFDSFEQNSTGLFIDNTQTPPRVMGLPSGPGSLIIGSPYVRPLNNYNPRGVAAGVTRGYVETGFSRSDQGIFVTDSQPMGSIYVHGLLYGSSQFTNSLDKMYVGYLLGSINVAGDLGSLTVGSDAGAYAPEQTGNQQIFNPLYKSGSQLVVGRTAGEIVVAGRSLMDITVVGNLNSPQTAPARDSYTYYEKEFTYGFDPTTPRGIHATFVRNFNNSEFVGEQPSQLFRDDTQAMIYGNAFLRNDSILHSEFVGSGSSSVRIKGELSGRDPVNGEDPADVYAFAADGQHEVVFDVTGGVAQIRVMDQEGRTIAAPKRVASAPSTRVGALGLFTGQLRFKPDAPGVYYVALTDGNLGDPNGFVNTPYSMAITGIAPVTLGSFRSGAGSGQAVGTSNGTVGQASITVLSGDVGTLRWGAGINTNAGAETDPRAAFNPDPNPEQDADAAMALEGGTYSVAGSLYSLVEGSDIGAGYNATGRGVITMFVGGNLGSLFTGLSPVAGRGPNEGDLNDLNLRVGGSIGVINIQGGVGMDQDFQPNPRAYQGEPSTISTGTAGGRGDIAFVRVGFHTVSDALAVTTSPGSTIGNILVSQDVFDDADPRSGIYRGVRGLPISTGPGSDVRFVDTPQLDILNSVDTRFDIFDGVPIHLVDDGGAQITIIADTGASSGVLLGKVVALPIDGSQGVAIGLIRVDLSNGATLSVTGSNLGNAHGTVGIGHIVVTGGTATSQINISGNIQVDVYNIEGRGGAVLGTISDTTPGGDIVSVDIAGLNTLEVSGGNLGSTETVPWGPGRIGVRRGVSSALANQVLGPLGFVTAANNLQIVDDDLRGGNNVFRPIRDDVANGGDAYLDDIGAPLDGQLNGLVVRAGNVASVSAGGSVGDVILEGGAAILGSVRANGNLVTPLGGFDGVVGNIYAFDIVDVDLGDGLAPSDPGPFATSSIVAANDIVRVSSSKPGAVISSIILASNIAPPTGGPETEGITEVRLNNGQYRGAYVGAANVDNFWISLIYGEDNVHLGNIGTLAGTNANFYKSIANAIDIQNFQLDNGYFDASTMAATGSILNFSVLGTRNSTLTGTPLEARENTITSARDVQNFTVVNDMADVSLDVTGSLTGLLSVRNIVRSSVSIDNTLQAVTASNIRSSDFNVGQLPSLHVAQSIESSTFAVSGPIQDMSAGDAIENTTIAVTGPNAQIVSLQATNQISGTISASGPIGTITSLRSDIVAQVSTTTALGNVSAIRAGRDVNIRGDISGGVAEITAGRNFGALSNKAALVVRGDFGNLRASTGQLYTDLRVAGNVTGTVSVAQVLSKPTRNLVGSGSIVAFGSIATVSIAGDFGGDIISYTGGIGSVTITNGSFLPGRTIAAYDGDINALSIVNGNLYGNVHADFDIRSLRVTGGADGVFGDVGANPALSQFTTYDALRNQLPVGVGQADAAQGPAISAGRNILSVSVPNGAVFESTFIAGLAIRQIAIGQSVSNDARTTGTSSYFIAGDDISNVTIAGSASDAMFLAGVTSLGADNRPGGTGANADIVRPGTITKVAITGNADRVVFAAGISAGADGRYNTADDRTVLGLSAASGITVGGATNGVVILADQVSGTALTDARFARNTALPSADSAIDPGAGTPGVAVTGTQSFAFGGGTVTLTFAGAGQAFFDAGVGRVTLRNTTSGSSLTVASSLATLNNFDIVSNDDASIGTLRISAALGVGSDIVIDGNASTVDLAGLTGNGRIVFGGDVNSWTIAALTGGFIGAKKVQTLTVTGAFGNTNPNVFGEARIDLQSAGTINLRGADRGLISVDRDVTTISIAGAAEKANIRVGGSLNSFSAPSLSGTTLNVAQTLGSANISGAMIDSAIVAGTDLGTDAFWGGTGSAADVASSGFINSVSVGGAFSESDIVAGYLRGPDGFFGTSDDSVAPGLSVIGTVSIGGSSVGSTRLSESYRIGSSGTVSNVSIGGTPVTGAVPGTNFAVETLRGTLAPVPIQVTDIRVTSDSGIYSAAIVFNQPVDGSTIAKALSVSEVRGSGDVTIRLIETVDYTVSYDVSSNTAVVTFSQAVTGANLPVIPGKPGPGVYRFEFDQGVLRGKSLGALVDGNSDGFAKPGENFRGNAIVGDVGDKLIAETLTATGPNVTTRVDFYAPVNLDVAFDDPMNPDSLADTNRAFTVRGAIGDHPDNDPRTFSFASDLDLYQVTLQAGQILRVSALRGPASLAGEFVLGPDGQALGAIDPNAGQFNQVRTASNALALPVDFPVAPQTTTDLAYLIKTTGRYTIVIGNVGTYGTPGQVPNTASVPGGVGNYSFTVQLFDDGDSGFSSNVTSGDGTSVVNAPAPSAFAGNDLTLNTADDVSEVRIGDFTFTLDKGRDGSAGTADDVVTGDNGKGIVSTRAGDALTSSIASAIGATGRAGVPDVVTSDVDIFHLNGRTPIAPGTRMRATMKLSLTGADLGSTSRVGRNLDPNQLPPDLRGSVQFGLFDTSRSTNVDDAVLVFSPSDFSPNGGTPNTVIASDGSTTYGYDANGDFYIDFVIPDRQDLPGTAGTFALYVQGVFNTDYKLEVVTQGTGTQVRNAQNFFIETRGGSVDWLQAGHETTTLIPFTARTLGFTGVVAGTTTADQYVTTNLITALNAIFTNAFASGSGLNVRFSNNSADFEGQSFSTIYLTSTADPISLIFDRFNFGFNLGTFQQAFFSTQPFGFSQHSDALNANLSDEAVVFAPSLGLLGYTPSRTDLDNFVKSLTAAVSRRAGELMGLRIAQDNGGLNVSEFDFQSADSVRIVPPLGRTYAFPSIDRELSNPYDSADNTDFFLGRQNARSLLDKILLRV